MMVVDEEIAVARDGDAVSRKQEDVSLDRHRMEKLAVLRPRTDELAIKRENFPVVQHDCTPDLLLVPNKLVPRREVEAPYCEHVIIAP